MGGAYWKGALIKYFEPQEGRSFEGGRLLKAGCLFEHLRYDIYTEHCFSNTSVEKVGTR